MVTPKTKPGHRKNLSFSRFSRTAQETALLGAPVAGSYGVRLSKAEDPTRPELLRYSRSWQYPSNTVDPALLRRTP